MPELNRRKFLIASAGVGRGRLLSGVVRGQLARPAATQRSDRPLRRGQRRAGDRHAVRRQRRHQHRDPLRRQRLSRRAARTGLRPGDVLPLDDAARAQPGAEGPGSSCGTTSSWRSCAAWATRSPTTATSGRWTSGRPPRRPSPCRPAGSAAGSTPPADDPLRAVNIGCGAATAGRRRKVHGGSAFRVRNQPVPAGRSTRRWMRWAPTTPRHPGDGCGAATPTVPARTTDATFGRASRPSRAAKPQFAGRPAQHGGPAVKAAVPTRVYTVAAGRIRHPRRRTRNPAATAADARRGRHAVPAADGRRTCTARTLSCWCIRSSDDGSRPTPRRAPITAQPARCSSRAHRSRAASTATSPA